MKASKIISIVFLAAVSSGMAFGQNVTLLKLSELEERINGGGNVTYVVNFWATWCAPCVRELPYFQEIQVKYGGSDLKVLLVSLDAPNTLDSKVKPFVARSGITAAFFLLDETNQQAYIDRIDSSWSGALPATIIVNAGRGKKKFFEGEVTLAQLEEMVREVKN